MYIFIEESLWMWEISLWSVKPNILGGKKTSCRHQKLRFHVDLSHFTQNISPQVRRAENNNNNNNGECRGRQYVWEKERGKREMTNICEMFLFLLTYDLFLCSSFFSSFISCFVIGLCCFPFGQTLAGVPLARNKWWRSADLPPHPPQLCDAKSQWWEV